jgi:hypothetical protein
MGGWRGNREGSVIKLPELAETDNEMHGMRGCLIYAS